MNLPNDIARCSGQSCPSKENCRRFTERHSKSADLLWAALWARRGAGDSACENVIWIDAPVSTFAVNEVARAFGLDAETLEEVE